MNFTDDEMTSLRKMVKNLNDSPHDYRKEWNARAVQGVKQMHDGYEGVDDKVLASFAFFMAQTIAELTSLPPRGLVVTADRLQGAYMLTAAHLLKLYDAEKETEDAWPLGGYL